MLAWIFGSRLIHGDDDDDARNKLLLRVRFVNRALHFMANLTFSRIVVDGGGFSRYDGWHNILTPR